MKKGYIAAVLDDDFAENLRSYAQHKNVFCKHVTLAYNPSEEIFKKYEEHIGSLILVQAVAICDDGHCQAAIVHGVPSENEVAHITISTVDGVRPAQSNAMLAGHHLRQEVAGLVGTATIRFVQHQGSH